MKVIANVAKIVTIKGGFDVLTTLHNTGLIITAKPFEYNGPVCIGTHLSELLADGDFGNASKNSLRFEVGFNTDDGYPVNVFIITGGVTEFYGTIFLRLEEVPGYIADPKADTFAMRRSCDLAAFRKAYEEVAIFPAKILGPKEFNTLEQKIMGCRCKIDEETDTISVTAFYDDGCEVTRTYRRM